MATTIETSGLSCPQPVIMVKRAINKKQFPITVLIDNEVVMENVSRFAMSCGYDICRNEGDGVTSLVISS